MAKDDKPKSPNAEDQQGGKTHAAFLDQLHSRPADPTVVDANRLGNAEFPSDDGRHRLSEDREQHDEAEKNSENGKIGR